MTYFTSDTHFYHGLMADLRGFKTTEEMNEHIIQMWNDTVSRKDTTYHLGDFSFKDDNLNSLRQRLNGKIILIMGNHDFKNGLQHRALWTRVYEGHPTIKIDHKPVVLCHYPFLVWDLSHYNSYHLYGHVHGGLSNVTVPQRGKCFDIGWDAWGKPVSWEEVKKTFDGLPDNLNRLDKDAPECKKCTWPYGSKHCFGCGKRHGFKNYNPKREKNG